MPRAPLALAFAALLAACGTPQERCIDTATRDLRVVEGLISGLERDLARGYTVDYYQVSETRWVPCTSYVYVPGRGDRRGHYRPVHRMCLDDTVRTVSRPRAIDLAAERRNLNELRLKRAELARTADAAVAQCRAQFPEG